MSIEAIINGDQIDTIDPFVGIALRDGQYVIWNGYHEYAFPITGTTIELRARDVSSPKDFTP